MSGDNLPMNLPDLIHQVGVDLSEAQAILLADALSDSNTKNISLPQFYETAIAAIIQCDGIDECQTFIGVADMIRAYAAQARDKRMIVLARRMNARAWRRLGELLLQYPSGGSAPSLGRRKPDHLLVNKDSLKHRKPIPPKTRRVAAREAGLSQGATGKAIRIGLIPTDIFEQVVESEESITGLGLMRLDRGPGLRHDMGARARGGLRSTTNKALRSMSLFAGNHRPADLARCFTAPDAKAFTAQLGVIRAWLVAMDSALAKLAGGQS